MFAAVPKTPSRRPRIEEALGSGNTPTAPVVVDYSTVA